MFIMFPGFGRGKQQWNQHQSTGKHIKFIQELSKLGEVFTYTPIFYNVFYYLNNKHGHFYESSLDFTLNDLNIINHCRFIYEQVKNFEGKFILISHSIGNYFLYKFAELFRDRCLFSIVLDGSKIFPKEDSIHYPNITNEEFEKVKVLTKTGKKEHVILMIEYVKSILKQQLPIGLKELMIRTISIVNLESDDEIDKMKENEYLKQNNGNKFDVIYVIHQTHYLYLQKDVLKLILRTIRDELKILV